MHKINTVELYVIDFHLPAPLPSSLGVSCGLDSISALQSQCWVGECLSSSGREWRHLGEGRIDLGAASNGLGCQGE